MTQPKEPRIILLNPIWNKVFCLSVMHMNFTSRALTHKMDLWIVYPTPTFQDMIQHKDAYDPARQWPVVYMLHGAGGDGFEWVQRADVEAWCCKYGFIAVLPSCHLSFYNDTPDGRNFAAYVAWELPAMIEATFHASPAAKDRYIMGYSMGGFGAVRIGLCNPDRYRKIASLSGCMDVSGFINAFEGGSIFRIHGALAGWPDLQGGDNDSLALLEKAAARKARGEYVPPMYHTVGKQDFIYEYSQAWRKKAQALGLDFIYTEGEGIHDFSYWNPRIDQEVLPFFFGS